MESKKITVQLNNMPENGFGSNQDEYEKIIIHVEHINKNTNISKNLEKIFNDPKGVINDIINLKNEDNVSLGITEDQARYIYFYILEEIIGGLNFELNLSKNLDGTKSINKFEFDVNVYGGEIAY